MATIVKVKNGDETGMVGEIVSIKNDLVTIKVSADANTEYKFRFDRLDVISDDGLDQQFTEVVEADILRRLEYESGIDWDAMAEAETMFDKYQTGNYRIEELV